MTNFVQRRKLFFTIAGILILLSVAALVASACCSKVRPCASALTSPAARCLSCTLISLNCERYPWRLCRSRPGRGNCAGVGGGGRQHVAGTDALYDCR